MPDPNDPYGLGIEPIGSRPSKDDPYNLGIEPLGGVSSSGRSQQPQEESPWYENIATLPNAIRFGGSLAGDFAGSVLAPFTGGLSYPVLSFAGGALGELGGQIAGGEDINLGVAGTEGALNLLPGPNIPGARAGLSEVLKYGAKSALSGAGQGVLGANPRKWAQQGITDDDGINWATGEDYAREAGAGALFGGITGGALAGGRSLVNATRDAFPSHITETQTPPGLRLLGEPNAKIENYGPEVDWRNPREEDIIDTDVIPDDAPPYEPWRQTPGWDDAITGGQPPPPEGPAGEVPITRHEAFGEDEIPLGDSELVPDNEVNDGFISMMRDMGYQMAGKVPGGKTLFQRIASKLGEEKGSIPSYQDLWNSLKETLGRDPSQAEIEAAQGQSGGADDATPFQTGESIQPAKPISLGVANFPVSLRHSLDTILANTKNDAIVDQMAPDFQLQLGKVRDVQVLQEIVTEIDAAPQDAVTRALRDEVRRRIIAMSPPPTSGVPGGNVPVRQVPPNVVEFPAQPSGELRDFHKDLMGQVQGRSAELQQAAAELRQTYPNATGEQIHNVLSIQGNISRRRLKGRDASQQEELLARVVAALQQQEALAPKSGPTGLVPRIDDTLGALGVEGVRQPGHNQEDAAWEETPDDALRGGPVGVVGPTESGIENLHQRNTMDELGEGNFPPQVTPPRSGYQGPTLANESGSNEQNLEFYLQNRETPITGEIINPTDGPGSPGWQEDITSSTGDIERALNSAGPLVGEIMPPTGAITSSGGPGTKNVTPTGMVPYREPGSLMSPDPASPVRSTDVELAQLYTMLHGRPPQTMADLDQLRGIDLSIDAEKYGNERNALDAPITDEDIAMEEERAALEGPINLTTEEKAALTRNKARLFERLAGRNVTKDAMTGAPITGPISGDIEGGGLERVAEQAGMPSYEEQKADLDARQDAGMVADYEEELAALNESYGVISSMSVEMEDYVNKVQRAMAEGYKVYPAGYKADPDEPVAYTFEADGETFRAVGYRHLVTPDNPTGRNIKDSEAKQLPPADLNLSLGRDEPSFQRADAKGVAPFTPRSDDHINYNKGRGKVQIYNLAEDLNNQLARGIPDDPRIGTILEQAENLIMNETDPEIIRDNYEQLQVYAERAHLPEGSPDHIELFGMLRDTALDKLRGGEGPSFAKVAGGGLKIDADIRRTAVNITKDYTSPLPGIMAREGLQNTLDAADKVPNDGGEVRIRLTDKDSARNKVSNSTIEMHDNGAGMTETMLAEKLVRLFASGKENEAGATGGKGIGSASYILGGEYFIVNTVAVDNGRKYRIVAKGTPEQFMSDTGSDYDRTEVPMSTPTGTTIEVTLKDDQDIFYSTMMVRNIVEHSRNRKSKIIFDSNNYSNGIPISELEADPGIIDENKVSDLKNDKIIGDFTFKDSDIKIAIPDFDATQERSEIKVHYLNNGMYQFTERKHLNEKAKGVPEHVIVNIEPQMDEQDDNYPFINTREDVKKDMRETISQYIDKHISGPAIEKKKNRTQELYDSMPVVPIQGGTVRKATIFDPGERFTKAELKSIINSPAIQEFILHLDRTMEGGLRIIGRQNWSDRLEGIGIVFDPNMHGVHIPNPATKKSTILLNPFIRMEHGMSPEDNAFDATITILHEKAHIGEERGHQVEAPPMNFDVSQPRYGRFFASYWEQIRSHGDVGYQNTGHGVGFIQRLGEVYAKMGAANTFAAADKLEKVFTGGNKSGQYSPEFQRILQLYTESRRRPETTEDLLSGTGVKQKDKRSGGKGNVPASDQAVGDGTPARTAVELFRSKLPVAKGYEDTRFILPDGTRLAFKDPLQWHSPEAYRVGVPLDEALENGIVRFRNKAAEVHSPISASQAVHLADSMHMLDEPYLVMEVMAPNGQRQHTIFEQGTKPGKIREWVNAFFRKISEERGSTSGSHVPGWTPPTGAAGLGGVGGGAAPNAGPAGAGGLGGSGTPWQRTKQATGWGSGGKVVQNKQQMNWIKEAMAVPAGATTTMDLSAPFRQGLSMINTPQFWKAAYKMFGGLTEAGFNQIDAELRRKPVMQARRNVRTGKVMPSIAQEAGLKMFETAGTGGMNQRAQATASRWLEEGIGTGMGSKAWRNTVGVPIRMSNRAYITFLNHLKVNRFEYLMDLSSKMHQDVRNTGYARPGLFKQKFTQAEGVELNGYRNKVLAKEIADFVNTATGQGPLKTHVLPFKQAEISLEGAAEALQHTFFSPGLIASRVRMLNPSTYIMASPMVRKQYMQAAIATGAAWMGALGMIEAAGGDDVEVNLSNLTSADFGKAKIGDTRMDPGGGFQQFLVAMGRLMQGGTTSSASNEWRQFGEGFNAPTQKSNIERFLSNKLNPVTKFAYDLAAQSEYNPFHVGDRTAQLFVPLVIQDLIGLYHENPKMLPWMGPIMFGMGTQTYGRGESVGKLIAPENDWLAAGGGVVDLVPGQEDY